MDLVQIRYFMALARVLNFTRAAEQCNVTQPALTKSIKRLEEELGGPLILRERSLTQLTELGRTMLPLLARTADAAEAARAHAASVRRGEAPAALRIGVAPTVPLACLLPLLREVGRRAGLELELRSDGGAALTEAVLAGHLDAVLIPELEPLPERLLRWRLYPERIVLAAPDDHPLAAVPEVPAASLAGVSLLGRVHDPDGGPTVALDRLRDEVGVQPDVRHRGNSEEQLGVMIAAGLGVALVAGRQALPPGVVARPLASPLIGHDVVLAVAAGRQMNRAVGAFTKLVRARSWAA